MMLSTVTAADLGLWASVAGNVALVVALLVNRKQRVRIQPPPLQNGDEIKVVPKGRLFNAEACDAKHGMIGSTLTALEQEDARLDREISTIKGGMGEMERRLNDADEKRTSAIHSRLNAMPAEIVKQLVTAKQLFKAPVGL